ncbi:hypothetical protein NPIL_592321 [Nephila pilipes]|uniref:Uncharacterized protein n=1 Tax=Nephila pilipes TaxID=299642 RepID=A0A8X6N9K9_NEPPI|nr:hypothetical protein NPIL_592321 [Nephila pilipes]
MGVVGRFASENSSSEDYPSFVFWRSEVTAFGEEHEQLKGRNVPETAAGQPNREGFPAWTSTIMLLVYGRRKGLFEWYAETSFRCCFGRSGIIRDGDRSKITPMIIWIPKVEKVALEEIEVVLSSRDSNVVGSLKLKMENYIKIDISVLNSICWVNCIKYAS